MSHSFVLGQTIYTYNNTVCLNIKQRTHLPVVCSCLQLVFSYKVKNA